MQANIQANKAAFLYPAFCALIRDRSYSTANFSSVPNACAVRTDERTSSATVAAAEYSVIPFTASLAIIVPPKPKIKSIVGRIQDKIKVNFHDRINAIMKPEKNVATACAVIETLTSIWRLEGLLLYLKFRLGRG